MEKLLTALLLFSTNLCAQQIIPIPYAHAHNDYEHERPLLDALQHGFTSIEADVFAIDGELYVYHNRPGRPDPERTLKQLYLEPLRKIINNNGGRVYPDYTGHFQLMIDLKTSAETTYPLIEEQLQAYADLFSRIDKGKEIPGPVMVFLSGNRPVETILKSGSHIAKLDGRPEDLGKGYPAGKMPVISERYSKVLNWNGKNDIDAEQETNLRFLLDRVHEEGKQLRLWAMPEGERAWTTFLELGIDWINADDLARLQNFFLN